MDFYCALFKGEELDGLCSSKRTIFFPVSRLEREEGFLSAFPLVKVKDLEHI